MSSGRGRVSHHTQQPQLNRFFQTSNSYQGDQQQQQQSYNPGQTVPVVGGPPNQLQNAVAPPVTRFPNHDIKQQQQPGQQPQPGFQSQPPLVSVSANPPQQMYPQQYPGQAVGPGNGPAMHHQHMVPQPRQNFYQQQPQLRMAGPNHPGPRMPHMQNNSPRMVQQGHNGPADVGYPNPGGNGHIPQAPPPSQNQQPQQPIYTYTVNSPQPQSIIMLGYNQGQVPRPQGHQHFLPPGQFISQPAPNPGGQPQQFFFAPGMPPMQYQQHQLAFPQQVPGGPFMNYQQPNIVQVQSQLLQQQQQQQLQQQQQQPIQQQQQPTGPAPPRPMPTPTPPNQVQPPMSMPHMNTMAPSASMMQGNLQPHQMMSYPQPMGVVSQRASLPKRRSNAIPIVDPTTNSVIDPLAAKLETSHSGLTAQAEESSSQASSAIIMTAPPSKIIITAPPAPDESPAMETSKVLQTSTPLSQKLQENDFIVNRSRTTSETKNFSSQVSATSDVVDNVSVKVSDLPILATAQSAVENAIAASNIHSVNLNNNVAKSDEPAAIKIIEVVATSEKDAIPQTPKRLTPTLQDNPDYEPVSPTPLPETPKSMTNDDFIEAKSKHSKKKNNAAKKAELNQKIPMNSDMDAFRDLSTASTTTTASSSAVTTPDTAVTSQLPANDVKAAPAPSKTPEPSSNQAELKKEIVDVKPEATSQPEINNHVEETPERNVTTPTSELEPGEIPDTPPSSKSGVQLKLGYKYKEDQWSPINLEGKKQYDRSFLLGLRSDPLSLERPPNLPLMDIIKEKSMSGMNVHKMFNASMTSNDFTPGYIKPAAGRGSLSKRPSRDGHMGGNRDQTNKRPSMMMMPPPKIIDVKIEKVELHQTENAWKPGKYKEDTTNGESQAVNDVLLRKARGILNKLCPQKFDILVEKFNELQIDSEEKLRLCMELVFEKAVDEPGFSVAYARMCDVLQKKQVTVEVDGQQQQKNFRKLLVSRCQQEFERDYLHGLDKEKYEADLAEAGNDEAKKKIVQAEWEEKEMRARRRSLGNIRFIGELYKFKMLTARIMHECVKKLLKTTDEESLECLCRLLSTVGKDLECETIDKLAKSSSDEAKKTGLAPFDNYFKDVEVIINQKATSSRVRFMLQDLVDLRRSQWKPRRDVAGPKTIEQIHQEAEREKTQNQLLNELILPNRNRDGGMQQGGPPGMRGGTMERKKNSRGPNEDGWIMTQPTKVSQRGYDRIDSNKIANLAQSSARRPDPENIQLGPNRSWATGSGSMRISRTKEEPMPDVRNKYAMLNTQDSGPASLGGYSSMPPPSMDGGYDSRRSGAGPSRSMGMPGRSSRGPSADSEKKRAVEAVRQSSKPNGPQRDHGEVAGMAVSMGPPLTARPVPDSPKDATYIMEQSSLLRGKPDLSKAEISKKANLLLKEYLNNENEKEAIETACADFHSTSMELLVENLINGVLENSSKERIMVGRLLSQMLVKHVLLKKQYESGLRNFLSCAGDFIVDVPLYWTYMGEIIAPMIQYNALPLSFLAENNVPKANGFAGKHLAGVLHALSHTLGQDKLVTLWSASRLNIETFVAKEFVKNFVAANKLEFILKSGSAEPSQMSPETVKLEFPKILAEWYKDDVILWIEENIGERKTEPWFIRFMMTAVAESSILGGTVFNPSAFSEKKLLLIYLLDGNIGRQKEALYALQHLMHRLEHPNRVLHNIFECLYDLDIIIEEAFLAWENDDNPAEIEGKGVAIKSTTQFFTWLAEADDD